MNKNILPEKPWKIFLVVSAGVFMSTMDSSMINVALPVIMDSFHSSLAKTEWVVLIYLLTISVLLLFWGHISDRWCKGGIYSYGMLIFTIGSLLCTTASGIHTLIFFRFIQATGASMMMAVGPAIVKASFPPHQLGKSLGLIGVAVSLGLMAGPAVSGLILRWSNWRMIFFATVPVGLLFFFYGQRPLASLKKNLQTSLNDQIKYKKNQQPFDKIGAILWIVSITLTILFTTHITDLGTGAEIKNSTLFYVGLISLISIWLFFLHHEKNCPAPILPIKLFKKRFFLMAVLSALLSFAVLFAVLILIPFYLSKILMLPSDQIGYVMMAVPLCVFAVSPLAGKIHDQIGAKIVATSGLLCCLLSLIFLTTLSADSSALSVAWRLVFLGIGQAMFLSPNSAAVLSGVSHKQAGITSSLLATARNLGMLTGTALTGLIFTLHFSSFTNGFDLKDFSPSQTEAFMQAMRGTFQFWILLSLCGVLISWFREEKSSF